MRVGGEREIKVDVRIIAATNKDLESLVREGLFRKDLYYRLKVVVIEMPPLRERPEDILLLSNLFIEENNREHGKEVKGFAPETRQFMTQYHWPGNVRELRNVVERAMILSEHNLIDQEQLPFELRSNEKQEWGTQNPNPVEFTEDMSLDAVEKIHISRVLKKLDWNKSRTAKVLGVSRATLREKIRRYSLSES